MRLRLLVLEEVGTVFPQLLTVEILMRYWEHWSGVGETWGDAAGM